MAVTESDVRHIAGLARLGLPAERVPALVGELNGILAHMDALSKVATTGAADVIGVGDGGMPLRADAGAPYPLVRDASSFAPAMRHGFFMVPRLATHVAEGTDPVGDDSGENVVTETVANEEDQP